MNVFDEVCIPEMKQFASQKMELAYRDCLVLGEPDHTQ